MLNLDIPNRPFATDHITGFMLPDGIFETSLGNQDINVHVRNTGAAAVMGATIYVESVDDPGIVVTPVTFGIPNAQPGVNHVRSWQANFTAATPGVHRISFIVEAGIQRRRIIKKVFVTKVSFDAASSTFSADTPEGRIGITFHDFVKPRNRGCCAKGRDDRPNDRRILDYLRVNQTHDREFEFCLPQYLPVRFSVSIQATPPWPGQHGDLPFNDPWWKVLLCIIAALLLIAAAIAEAVDGSGSVSTTGGPGGAGSPTPDCCDLAPSGGGTSYVAAGLVAAAAAVATAAGLSDTRDPIRKGQDNTPPPAGAFTLAEQLYVELSYGEPVALGRPFVVGARWVYRRITNLGIQEHGASEANANIHTLSAYTVHAPDVIRSYQRERWIVRASFFDADGKVFRGSQLFVQCFLSGPAGQWRKLLLEDNGYALDEKPQGGVYTGTTYFSRSDIGLWTYFVIAQDVNDAQPDMTPEDAAQIIGGFVRTHQLTITFTGGECSLVADGHINVV